MRIARITIVCLFAFVGGFSNVAAQSNPVPNPSFEKWDIFPQFPTGWGSLDFLNLSGAFYKSTDAHSGSYAVGGKVVQSGDSTLAPILATATVNALTQSYTLGFPIGFKPASLEAFAKFTGTGGDFLSVTAIVQSKGQPIGTSSWQSSANSNSYSHIISGILYIDTAATPDSAFIVLQIGNNSGPTHLGSSFLIDDVALTNTIAPPQIQYVFVEGNPDLRPGGSAIIAWAASGELSSPIDLDVSYDGESTWTSIQHGLASTEKTFDWTLPNKTATGVIVRVTSGETSMTSQPFDIAVSGVAEPSHFLSARIVPNPANGISNIVCTLDESAPALFLVSDILGRTVLAKNFGVLGSGSQDLKFDVSGLAPGRYEYQLSAGNSVHRGMLSVIR